MLKSLFKSVAGHYMPMVALASQCAVCHAWPSRQVCDACISRFAAPVPRCSGCALPLPADLSLGLRTLPALCASCARQHPSPDRTLAPMSYAYPWSELVSRYKFGDRPGWAPFFAGLMLQDASVRQAFADMQPADLIIPLPLSAERLQSRGFNQAWELASALGRQSRSHATADATLLLRVKHTRPQTELKREARLVNVRGAFQADPLRATILAGKRVILVDDVMTSGASLFTAASVLRAAGAAHITALAFARTPLS